MHIIALVEHSVGDWEKILDWIHSIPVRNSLGETTYPCPRELRLVDITVDEGGRDQLLSYLPIGHGHVDSKKIGLMKKIIQRFSPLDPVDLSKIERKTLNTGFPKQTFAYFQILGSMPDNKNKEGLDML